MTKVLTVPRYGHITEDGHNWYLRSYSDFGKHPGSWMVWCEEHLDYHHVEQVDALDLPDSARDGFRDRPPAHLAGSQETGT